MVYASVEWETNESMFFVLSDELSFNLVFYVTATVAASCDDELIQFNFCCVVIEVKEKYIDTADGINKFTIIFIIIKKLLLLCLHNSTDALKIKLFRKRKNQFLSRL
jgi:hypothetical protein